MTDRFAKLTQNVSPAGLLGYLNFSDGRPDPKFRAALNAAFAQLPDDPTPHHTISQWLQQALDALVAADNPAFRDAEQVRAVLGSTFDLLLPLYRTHHADLLAHATDRDLFGPFFVAVACETVLNVGAPWDAVLALHRLNDYVGYRPIAVLETRPQTDFYPHEKLRPIPLFLRGSGHAESIYRDLVREAFDLIALVDADLRTEAYFDFTKLDELALDPRAFDHGHPVNRRPNYIFGEWDPQKIDNAGYYRRFVVRRTVLDALLAAAVLPEMPFGATAAAAVLGGTMLMASMISGEGPDTHDSGVKLATLVPRNARLRDAYYAQLIERVPGPAGEALRLEASRLKQPFGGIRRELNRQLARDRALQLQERHVSLLLAELGAAEASRERARRIPTASVRILSEIRVRQSDAHQTAGSPLSVTALAETEDLLRRGIDCGALPDPWNILGYQGLFPLFNAREDGIRDQRNDELIDLVSRQFDLYAEVLAALASAGDEPGRETVTRSMHTFAEWWDRFAAFEVSEVTRLSGAERADAAVHVAEALARWNRRAPADGTALAFWREQREGFTSPTAYAQVIEALLDRKDWSAAQALLISWLSESETIPLTDEAASFGILALRWLEGVIASRTGEDRMTACRRFLDLIEANAEDYWAVPELDDAPSSEDAEDDPFGSAYEGVTYQDSTDDGEESSIAGDGPRESFDLEDRIEPLRKRLDFLSVVAELWSLVAEIPEAGAMAPETLTDWFETATRWRDDLHLLMDAVHDREIPAPVGAVEDVIEYDRLRALKDELTDSVIDTAVDMGQALRQIAALTATPTPEANTWEARAINLERAIAARDPAAVRRLLPGFLRLFAVEPLLLVPLGEGGSPKAVRGVRATLAYLESLFERLPRLGLIRETYRLLQLARTMERNGPQTGRNVSDFDRLFRVALKAVVEAILAVEPGATPAEKKARTAKKFFAARNGESSFASPLRTITESFLKIWIDHSQSLRLSSLESLTADDEWQQLKRFIQRYGRDLFTSNFMTWGNLRGILHRGVGTWLESLAESDEDGRPETLLTDLASGAYPRASAVRWLEIILHAVAQHYEEYKDYKSSTTQSDYGENLHLLLEFLRVKGGYERYAWRMRPLIVAHELLCRHNHDAVAQVWRDEIAGSTRSLSERFLQELTLLERQSGVQLRTIRDRLEERFTQPLALDRLGALAEPALREGQAGNANGASSMAFRDQLASFTAQPAGVGWDVPPWIRRLEAELEDARERLRHPLPPPVNVPLTLAGLTAQLAIWDDPE